MSSPCPPLFDNSPKRATKRLFLYASDGIVNALRTKYGVRRYLKRDYDFMARLAWLTGATSTAQALVREVRNVNEAWEGGDDHKTVSLTKIATAHMISVWYDGIEDLSGQSDEHSETCRRNAATSMMEVINDYLACFEPGARTRTAQDVKAFLEMDIQLRWENTQGMEHGTYVALLLARALEACGQQCVEWHKVQFPIDSLEKLKQTGAVLHGDPLEDRSVLLALSKCLQEGTASMRRFHDINKLGEIKHDIR